MSILRNTNARQYSGSEDFKKIVDERYLQERHRISEIPEHKNIRSLPTLEEISAVVSGYYRINPAEIKMTKRGDKNIPRKLFMYLSQHQGQYDQKSIAGYLGNLSVTAVSKSNLLLELQQGRDARLRQGLEDLRLKLNGDVKS